MNAILYNEENCYVCNQDLGPCRNSLDSLTSFSGSALYEILESITGADFGNALRQKTSICQQCFITLDTYDELQKKKDIIQEKVADMFQKTHSVQVFIKEEKDISNDATASDVKIKCQKCKKNIKSLKDLVAHKHEDRQPQTSSLTKSSQVSKTFVSAIKKQGLDYNYEMFQRVFFTENEKESLRKPSRIPSDDSRFIRLTAEDKKVSKSFRSFADDNGIDYNIESFQKAFGYSETESNKSFKGQLAVKSGITGKSERWVMGEKVVKSDVKPSPTVVKALKEEGIDYNLDAFQKAFGCVDSKDLAPQLSERVVPGDQEMDKIMKQGYIECGHKGRVKCKARFTNRQSFSRHVKTHEMKDKNLYCEDCSKSFKSSDCLQIHLATDHGKSKGEVDCPVCLKSCLDSNALRSHYYIHKTERSFLCGKCGATFVHKKSFVSHMMMHDDVRNFACTIPGCTKKFRNSAKLKIHIRVHTGEKIYECPLCPSGRKFAQKWGLDLHAKKQHRNEIAHREMCKICGVKVPSESKLKIHLAIVHQVAGTSDTSSE